MIKVKIKPLSVNEAFKGRRVKTQKYKIYELALLVSLPIILDFPDPPYRLSYEFGFSSKGADVDNPIKQFTDVLSKKYGFNDNEVYQLNALKVIVPKGSEFVKFKIEHFDKCQGSDI